MAPRRPFREPSDDLGRTIPPSEADAIARGQQAWARHKKDAAWADWLAIGEALVIGRRAAMAAAQTNEPSGSRYNREFGNWLERNGFGDIDKSDRAKLFKVMEARATIEQWRATLTQTERLRLNHPAAVWRRWQAATKAPAHSIRPTLRDTIANLKQGKAVLEARVQDAEAARDLVAPDPRTDDLVGLVDRLLLASKQYTPEAARMLLEADAKQLRALGEWCLQVAKACAPEAEAPPLLQ
jgi:hypothetical protein